MNNIYFFGGGKLMASIIDAINKNEYKKNLNNMYLHQLDIQKKKISQKLNLKQYLLKNKIQFEIINKIDKKIKKQNKKKFYWGFFRFRMDI